jgi:hypothetical protein
MLDAGMQEQGKAHIARVLGQPKQSSPKILWSAMAFVAAAGAVSFFLWPSAPGDDQLGKLTILSSCDGRTPGQAWLEARSAAGADGANLSSAQRRAAMDYLLGGESAAGCESVGGQNDDGEALAFSEGD